MGRGKFSESSSESGSETGGHTGRRQLCRSKNAQLARENRIKKKKYVEALEQRLGSLRADNKELRRLLGEQAAYVAELQQDVRYLRAALANRGPIASLLRRLAPSAGSAPPTPGPFDLPLDAFEDLNDLTQLPSDADAISDHNYTSHLISDISNEPLEDVGICLHVTKKKMSLEFCSICNERAIKNTDFVDF